MAWRISHSSRQLALGSRRTLSMGHAAAESALSVLPHWAPVSGISQSSRRGFARASFVDSEFGMVSDVAGDTVVLRGMSKSKLHALVTFGNGSLGLVTDMRTNGSIHVSVLHGPPPRRTETAAVENQSLGLNVCGTLAGRVIDPLGRSIDGGVPTSSASHACARIPLFASESPGVVERGEQVTAIPTCIRVLDTFFPLIRGRVGLLAGRRDTDKRKLATDIISAVAASNGQCEEVESVSISSCSPSPISISWVAVGYNLSQLKQLWRTLQESGAAPYVTLIATTSDSSPAMQYLAPFTGAALGELTMRRGGHSLVVLDNLSQHFIAARSATGMDWLRTDATPTFHGALMDRCAQLGEAQGGGSMSMLAMVDTIPTGPGYTRIEHIKERHLVAQVASVADVVIPVSAAHQSQLVPIDFLSLLGRTGHISQGPVLRYYSTRTQQLLCQLKEVAAHAVAAAAVGVERESDSDEVLDILLKARILLLPDTKMLGRLKSSKSPEAAAALSVSGLTFPNVVTDADVTSRNSDAAPRKAGSPMASINERVTMGKREHKPLHASSHTHTADDAAAVTGAAAEAGATSAKRSLDTAATGRIPFRRPSTAVLDVEQILAPSSSSSIAAPLAGRKADSPAEGDTMRTLLSLFVLTHAYVQRVPLTRLLEYESQLYHFLRSTPYTAESDAAPGGFLPNTHPCPGTLSPASTCVLGAAVAAQLASSFQNDGTCLDIRHTLRAATLNFSQYSTEGSRLAGGRVTSPLPTQAPPLPLVETSPLAPVVPKPSWFGWLSTQPAVTPPALPSSAISSATESQQTASEGESVIPYNTVMSAPRHAISAPKRTPAEAILRYVRLDVGQDLECVPPPLRALHILVADFTRRFCDEPL